MSEIIPVVLEQGKAHVRTEAQWKYNKGQKLQILGIDIPEYFEVHFSNSVDGKSKTMIGQNDIVEIPSEYFNPGAEIYCWIYIQEGSASVTKYEIVIPIRQRAEITDEEPTPQQESVIEQAITALNNGVTRSEAAADAAELSKTNAAESEQNAAASEDAARLSELHAKSSEDVALASAQSAERSMTHAAESAYNARVSEVNAEDAADRAEQAAITAGYLDVDIDEHGHLIYTKTDAVDVDFDLVDGHLIMEAV